MHRFGLILVGAVLCVVSLATLEGAETSSRDGRYLYVATPGIRNYLEYGGHGLLIFDIDHDYRFVKRVPTAGVDAEGKPLNVKGVCASAKTGLLHISTIKTLMCVDLMTEEVLWEKPYKGGCDRMALSPDGTIIYLPSLESDHWHVVQARTGEVIAEIVPKSGAHNTVYGPDGKECYLAGLRSPHLSVADTATHTVVRKVGPFSGSVRPFTVNGAQTLCFVNVNDLLGFEVGDLKSGRVLHHVEVEGFKKGPVKRHGCPSHGIGLTPDEKEVWVSDGANSRMHIFEIATMPPKQVASIELRDQPGWVTFSLDGKHGWPSTGEVIDVASRKIVARLTDETGRAVGSEKIVEVQWKEGKLVRTGDQFGIGQVR